FKTIGKEAVITISGGLDEVASNKKSGVPAKYELQQHASVGSNNLPSQTILNPRGNASVVTLRSGRELQQTTPQQEPRPTDADSKLDANS
ncbi:hypothetical protein CR513_01099, partial [Mucuna pruriens]